MRPDGARLQLHFTRVLTIIGLDRFIAWIAERAFYWMILLIHGATRARRRRKTAWTTSSTLANTKRHEWTLKPILVA